ncbi:hypothetical protein FRB90_011811, partial [Tulasnella sp. 427]
LQSLSRASLISGLARNRSLPIISPAAIPKERSLFTNRTSDQAALGMEKEDQEAHESEELYPCIFISSLKHPHDRYFDQYLRFNKRNPVLTRKVIFRSRYPRPNRNLGEVIFTFPKRLLPEDGSDLYCSAYFDPLSRELRFCTHKGEDIPGASISLMQLARSRNMLPMLKLAQRENLLGTVPDGYLSSLKIRKALNSGYYTELELPTEGSKTADVTIVLHMRSEFIRLKTPVKPDPSRATARLVPYVNHEGALRLWDKERFRDWEPLPGTVFEMSPLLVEQKSEALFALGCREQIWPNLRYIKPRIFWKPELWRLLVKLVKLVNWTYRWTSPRESE